ncbi:MAG: crossover junction endodeoxyribonuclease RuvC, partial [Anaerolineae bacterium]
MLSLGVDPGTATVGYGLVEEMHDGTLRAVTYGTITTPPSDPMWMRLRTIYDNITALVSEYHPDRAAVEELFFAKNVTTAIT